MKKREIENYNLEHLFNQIIEQTPLISEEQVVSLLINPPVTISGSFVKRFFQNRLNTFLFIGTVVLITVAAFIWIRSNPRSEDTTLRNNQMKNQEETVSTDTIAKEPAVVIDNELSKKRVNKEIVLKEFSKKTSIDTVQTVASVSLSDIYKHFDKKPQKFLIQANSDTTVICKEGTTVKIKAHSFISGKNGNEISGTVQIDVKEYYKLSDILLSNLTTTSGDKILETGGMLYISASSDAEYCLIKPGHNIEIGFPFTDKKEEMALFYGVQTNNGIDWQPPTGSQTIQESELAIADREEVETSIQEEPKTEVYIIVEEMPEFPGGETALRKYLEQNVHYPYTAIKDRIEGKVYVTFLVDKTGNTRDIRVVRGLDKLLDKVAVYLVSNMPKWKPGRQRGKPVNVSYTVPVTFSANKGELTPEDIEQSKEFEEKLKNFKYDIEATSFYANNQEFKEFEKKVTNNNFKGTTASEVNRYLFSVTQLGWINCDRFYKNNNPMINFFILTDNSNKTIVNAILRRFKAIIPGKNQSGKITFENIPLGEKVTIVALKTVNNEIFLSVKETELTKNGEIVLDFNPVTLELLKKEMEKLNTYY